MQPTLRDTGLLYAIISPIILPFQVLTIGLFWIIYSHSREIGRASCRERV